MRKPKATEYAAIARDIAENSIVTHALSRLIEQIVAEVHAAEKEKRDELEAQLSGYAEARNAAFFERDAALADARELRELLKEARYEFIHITRYDEDCEIIKKIDAKLTEGA